MIETNNHALLFTLQYRGSLSLPERILDRLADVLWLASDITEMIEEDPSGYEFRDCEREVRRIFESANALMQTMTD